MLSEGFGKEYNWISHDGESGIMPVPTGTLVDVKYRDGENTSYGLPCGEESIYSSRDASNWFWLNERAANDIVAWRLHLPSKLPQPTRPAPPMPTIKPCKQEDVFIEVSAPHVPDIDPLSQSKVVQAFNRMTGHNITDDNLNTLKVLVDLFGSGNGTN